MLNSHDLSKLRFGMSEVPKLGGPPGLYEEKWSQWFLEQSFFRDFVYRNPKGEKKGQELADAVVLFGDVVLMIQVKAQHGDLNYKHWATEALLKAFTQLSKTHDTLVMSKVKKLRNDFYGDVDFDPQIFPNRFGIIVLAHSSEPYIAAELAPEILAGPFPTHVFSLADFEMLATRFDTAGDMITFLELRADAKERYWVQDELGNMQRILPHIREILRSHLPGTSEEIIEKSYRSFEEKASGRLVESNDWRFGLAIDDMIARAHNVDPDLPWSQPENKGAHEIARFLGWLTRDRRIKLGKRVIEICEAARDGNAHFFPYRQPSRGTACVFLSTAGSRESRVQYLQFLVAYAQMKYGIQQCLGVATEPIGGGRSYDFVLARTFPPAAIVEGIRRMEDPFPSSEEPL